MPVTEVQRKIAERVGDLGPFEVAAEFEAIRSEFRASGASLFEHDLTQLLDSRGTLISDFPHPNTGPVPAAMRRRALAVPEATRLLQGSAALIALVGLALSKRRPTRWRRSRHTG